MHLPNLDTIAVIANHLRLRRFWGRVSQPSVAIIILVVLFGAVVTLLGLHPRLVELRDNSPYYLLGTVHPYLLLVLEASLAALFLLSAIVVVAYHSRNPAAVMIVALLMLYIFPDGQFMPRWTRWLFAVWVVMNVLWLLIPTLPFNPSYGGTWRATMVAAYMFHIAYFMSGMGAQWYRYRHTTDDQQRRQLRWGLAGLLIAALGTVIYFGVLVWGQDNFPYTPTTALVFLYGRMHAAVQTIGKELRLRYVAVELHATPLPKRQTVQLSIVSFGVPTTPNHRERFPSIVQGKNVGVLIISLRDGQAALAPADMDVLHALATQIGSLVQTLQLTADLQESRQRLVAAREEERRRLRRDLHDSVGPMLATLSMQTETARELIATQTQRSEALLGDVLLQLQTILGDIRRVVYGLRPPALDDLGLVSALRTQSAMFGQGKVVLRVMIEEPLPPLSAATEVAIYRIVQEALTNIVRHADARNANVRMSIDTAQSLVVLKITDDGKGIAADSRSGVGLHSMHEGAAELNSTCTIHSSLGEGTKIKVVLPW